MLSVILSYNLKEGSVCSKDINFSLVTYCTYILRIFSQYLVFPPLISFIGFVLIQMNFKWLVQLKNLSIINFVFLQRI